MVILSEAKDPSAAYAWKKSSELFHHQSAPQLLLILIFNLETLKP